jgi:hypothetical protein
MNVKLREQERLSMNIKKRVNKFKLTVPIVKKSQREWNFYLILKKNARYSQLNVQNAI